MGGRGYHRALKSETWKPLLRMMLQRKDLTHTLHSDGTEAVATETVAVRQLSSLFCYTIKPPTVQLNKTLPYN